MSDVSPQDLGIDPQSRDLAVRTMLGEAADQGDTGLAAVGSVILNRLKSGNYGDDIRSVVLARNQFEPWATRARELAAISPKSDAYQRAGQLFDKVASGDIEDPTDGATHFLQPDIVRARRGGSLPNWAQGPGTRIGAHVFYKPDSPSQPSQQAMSFADVNDNDVADTMKLLKVKPSDLKSTPNADSDIEDTMRALGIKPTEEKKAVPSAVTPAAAPPAPADDRFKGRLSDQIVAGMPIVGPLFDKGMAAFTATADPYLLRGYKDDGSSWSERYAKNLAGIQGGEQKYAAENPITSTAANFAGGVVGMGGGGLARNAAGKLAPAANSLADTKLGRIAFGIEGPTFASRLLQGIAGGTALGASDAALRGENVGTGALLGGAGGAAGPVVGEGVGAGARFVANHFMPRQGPLKGVGGIALNRLVGGLEGETPASIAAGRENAGPAGFLADIAPGLTDIAGGIADTPGAGKAIIREAYRNRALEQGQRIDAALTQATGQPATNIEAFKNFWTEARKAAADPLYEQWRTMQVQPTQPLKDMIPRLEKAGAFKMADELAGINGDSINQSFFTGGSKEDFPTTQTWDYVKRGLDRRIDQAYSSNDKTLASSLLNLKNQMISEIEKTPAGQVWNQARTAFADRSAILDQIEAGKDTLLGSRSGLSVDQLREELKGLKGPELAARVVGMRNAAAEAMGETIRGDTTLRNKILAPNNQAKMKLLLGDDKANDLIKSLKSEQFLSDQGGNVIGNQNTGASAPARTARKEALQPSELPHWNPNFTEPLSLVPPQIREGFRPTNLVDAWRGRAHSSAIDQLAPLLTKGGPSLDDLIGALQAEQTRRGKVSSRSSSVGNALSTLVAIPGATSGRLYVGRQ